MPTPQHSVCAPDSNWRSCRAFPWFCAVLATCFSVACTRSLHRAGNPAANASRTAAAPVASLSSGTGAANGDRLGTVHVIGTAQRFVLIETPTFQPVSTLIDGQALVCRTAGNVTAALRVSHERRPPFVVADVATGEPHVGDEVFIDTAPARTMIPAPQGSPQAAEPNSPTPAATPDFRADPALPPAR